MTTIQNTRPFIIIYNDCFESDIFDNIYQKMVYIALKKFANKDGQCFPSLKKIASIVKISIRKVQYTLLELKEKLLISIEHRKREDGGYTSNLYTIYDINEIQSEKKGTSAPTKATSDTESTTDATTMSIKEKKSISAQTKETDIDTKKTPKEDNTTKIKESQVQSSERYTLDQIHQYFDYDALIQDPNYTHDNIDSVMSILYNNLNKTKSTIRINGEDKPPMVVISKLMKLNKLDIKYVIDKFKEQSDKIKNPTAYLLTMLYHAPEQRHLDEQNKLAQKNQPSEPNKQKNTYYNKPKNQFFEFHQREVTDEELDELERQLLRIGLQKADDIEKEEVAHELEQEVLENKRFKDTEETDKELERKLLGN